MGAKSLTDIIRRPIITEKAAVAQQELNAHVFEVDRKANKLQIKQAVQQLFSVKVRSVRTMIMPSKWKRSGRTVGKVRPWKKAIVTLAAGETIQVAEG